MGFRLKTERKKLNLDQVSMAEIGGISEKVQSGYETGKTAPNVFYLWNIYNAGADIHFIVTGTKNSDEKNYKVSETPVTYDETTKVKDESNPKDEHVFLLELHTFTVNTLKAAGVALSDHILQGMAVRIYEDHLNLPVDLDTRKQFCKDFVQRLADLYIQGKEIRENE